MIGYLWESTLLIWALCFSAPNPRWTHIQRGHLWLFRVEIVLSLPSECQYGQLCAGLLSAIKATMQTAGAENAALEKSAYRKASLRILPLIALGYGAAYIDR